MSDVITRVKTAGELKLWLPRHGRVDARTSACIRTVERYDEALVLGRHSQTNDWCVFIKKGPFDDPFPVLGLGQELPSPEELEKRLILADTARQGNRVLDELERANARLRSDAEAKASEATGAMAEAYEWGHRAMGAHPQIRIFVPAGI